MNAQAIIFITLHTVLPELLTLGCLAASALLTWRARSVIHGFATAALLATTLWSLVAWYQIYFLGAFHVICSPLILNCVGFGFFAAQLIWLARHDHAA